jgi:translation elongation factor EF-Tu-like GTPase
MQHLKPSFIAALTYLKTEEGGRETPAKSGYRPQVKFSFSEMQTSGQQVFLDKELVYPGETVRAEITVLTPEILKGKIKVGMTYEFREGAKIMGTGEILEILDKDLG